jgi:hypothetical protein
MSGEMVFNKFITSDSLVSRFSSKYFLQEEGKSAESWIIILVRAKINNLFSGKDKFTFCSKAVVWIC